LTKGKAMVRFARQVPFLCALALPLASCAAPEGEPDEGESGVAEAAEALTNATVSFLQPDGFILSTGNLYFTTHDAAGARVVRMAQGAGPGQEIVLYSEAGVRFGDIVFAQVGSAFFGYFFSTDGGATSTIKRVPLAGGPAVTLATLTNIDIVNSHRNLAADGVNLYWQDVSSVRKMPIGGGAITVLDASSPNTPSAGIALQGDNVIYASVNDVRFVPKAGAVTSPLFRTIATASSRVTALHAVSNGVYWGEQGGAVRRKVGTTITTISTGGLPVPTAIANSSATAGGTQTWSQCGSSACTLHVDRPFPFFDVSVSVAADALGVSVSPSSGAIFWGDAAGVHRLTL
jgi:hypothetical protein